MSAYDIKITACAHCRRSEFDWRPNWCIDQGEYTCTICLDQPRLTRHRNGFTILHRQLLAVLLQLFTTDLYDYTFPTDHDQWKALNQHNRMQRTQTLQLFLSGAPWSKNHIYDLHQQLQQQMTRGHIWNGRRYHHSSWDSRTDFLTVLCNFLT